MMDEQQPGEGNPLPGADDITAPPQVREQPADSTEPAVTAQQADITKPITTIKPAGTSVTSIYTGNDSSPGPSSSPPLAADIDAPTKYCVEFVENNSKKWDGKRVWLEGEWLSDLFAKDELVPGKRLSLPFPSSRGSSETKDWNAILIDPNDHEMQPQVKRSKRKRSETVLTCNQCT